MPTRRPTLVALALLAVAALGLSACGDGDGTGSAGSSAPDGDRPTIVATTGILGDITANVVGDLADVQVLLPPGADPHDFEPSARQAAQLRDADLVIANGLGLEAGLDETLDALPDEGVPVLEIGPEVSPMAIGGDGHDGSDDHGDLDPHVWMDPDRMAAAAVVIGERVATETGLDPATLAAQAQDFDDQVVLADAQIQATLAAVPDERRVLVTNHDSFGYFADRYGFEVVGTVIPGSSTQAEPSASAIADLAQVVRDRQVPAIFAETTDGTDLARTLADEAGTEVTVVTLSTGSLGAPGSGADTYLTMMTTNADLIAGALTP